MQALNRLDQCKRHLVLAMLHDGLALKSAGADKVTKALTKQVSPTTIRTL